MKLHLSQLFEHLKKELAPTYWISGDVPALKKEALRAIIKAAQERGFTDHEIHSIDESFDWAAFSNHLNHFSLWGEKRVIELQSTTTQLGAEGGKVLSPLITKPHEDKILVLITPKLDARTQQSAWARSCLANSLHVPIWPIDRAQYPFWLHQQLKARQLEADPAALQLLTQYTEGNLDAALQTIEKLELTFKGFITLDNMQSIITDHRQFNLFDWVDTCLSGDRERIMTVFHSLKKEGCEPVLILFALTETLRKLIRMIHSLAQGDPLHSIYKKQGVWDKQKPYFQQALKQHTLQTLKPLIHTAHSIDRKIKGVSPGSPWNDLLIFGLTLGGIKTV